MLCLEKAEVALICHVQVRKSNADVQAASLLIAVEMDGIGFMGKIPGLAVDCRRCQSGRLQSGIGLVHDLFQRFALKTL